MSEHVTFERTSADAGNLVWSNGKIIGTAVRDVDGDWLWFLGGRDGLGGWPAYALREIASVLEHLGTQPQSPVQPSLRRRCECRGGPHGGYTCEACR